ncbi:carbohydrate ABC transporter permease [Microbacterium trichothecenolyticum]|nr:sugar ABC transporter permease [Microbacterium trichothecenolyticum]
MDLISRWAQDTSVVGKVTFALAVVVALLLIFRLLLLLADHAPRIGRKKWQAALFLLPVTILLLIGFLGPIVSTVTSSLTAPGEGFVFLDNFVWAFTNPDAQRALGNTLLWVIIAPITATVVGLVYAMLIDGSRSEAVAKALVFFPTAISFVGAAVIWGLMYQQPGLEPAGLVNVILGFFGLEPLGFPTNPLTVTPLMIVVMVWIQAGFATVTLSAAIKAVPVEILEAARIDGASSVQIFWRVILPSIQATLIIVLVTISVLTLKVFDLIKAFGADRFGGDTLANMMYTIYSQSDVGSIGEHYSSTLAMIIFLLVIPFLILQIRQMRKNRAIR